MPTSHSSGGPTPRAALLRSHPVAVVAFAGLAAGIVLGPFHTAASNAAYAGTLLLAGVPVVWSNLRSIMGGKFHSDTIAALAILASAALGEYFAGAVVVLMQSGGEALEDYGLQRANRSLDALLRRAPTSAMRLGDHGPQEVKAEEIEIGDLLLIRPGDIIAADGVVVDGEGAVDESALTGEPVPLAKKLNDRVYSGTINLTGSFQIRTTNTAAKSKYELIVQMVRQAQGERAPINRLANRYTPVFTIMAISLAGLAALLSGSWERALSVLVVATPCPLIIATPIAVLSAVNRAASMNIIVKSGAAIENAGTIDTIVFDKTGTLTVGQPSLTEVRLLPGAGSRSERDILALAAGIELHSSSIIAREMLQAATLGGISPPEVDEPVIETPGRGLSGSIQGERIHIGSPAYCQENGIELSGPVIAGLQAESRQARTVAVLSINQLPAALFCFEDRLRTESPSLIRRLQQLGIKQYIMLTGDSQETAQVIGGRLGIGDIRSRLLPEEKLEVIHQLREQSNVMMVGDGINDAPALSAATLGVAMGGFGAGVATDSADIVITVENIERVADVIEIGRRMTRVAKSGIFLGIGASAGLMVVASLGHIPPATGALLQEALDLITIINALRAR